METTRLSHKGQVVIPKQVREAHGWEPGVEFVVEDMHDGIWLKPLKPYRESKITEVLGCLNYKGPKRSLRDMDSAIAKGAKEQA